MKLKPPKMFFNLALAACAVVLVAFYAVREVRGPFLPQVIDENFFTGFIVVLMGLFLWNRKLRSDERNAAAADPEKKESDSEIGAPGECGEGQADGDRKGGDAGN
jgi:hypothetical protein